MRSVQDNEEVEKAAQELTQTPLEPAPKETRSIRGIRWLLIVLAIQLSSLIYSLDNSVVADIQPKIVNTFGQVDKLPWLSVAYALGGAATTLCWSTLYVSFDTKIISITGLVFFEAGSAICGSANNMDVLIIGRTLAGMGGAGLYIGALTLLSALTLPGERPIYMASIGLNWGAGNVLGFYLLHSLGKNLADTMF
jgi:MFS family permease